MPVNPVGDFVGLDPDYDRGPINVQWKDLGGGTAGKVHIVWESRNYVWDGVSAWVRETQPGGGGGSTDVTDRAARLLGHVTVDNANLAVTGTFWQSTQPVSGPLTDTQLRASAVPVSGPLTDTQLRASAVPVSGPLTDTQLRATAVPVSGPLTDTQLRAAVVPTSNPDIGTAGLSAAAQNSVLDLLTRIDADIKVTAKSLAQLVALQTPRPRPAAPGTLLHR